MICPQCQCENLPDAVFCDRCGMPFETVCSHCGQLNRSESRFCRICGHTIPQTAAIGSPRDPEVPPPDTYIPKHLAEKILASRQSLEGERKQVTVLFADIRDSMKLIENRDPEEAQKIIDPVLHLMMDAVHRYEGTVNQVLGDGIMALFGAPLAHEDHALRACYAAIAMQNEMRRHREKMGQSDELGLHIGVGLNSGEVVVRSIGNDLNIDYSALGHTTHLAARMEELASAGSILMAAATLREVEGFVEVKSLGAVQVKGVSRPVDAYELLGVTSARTRLHAAATRGLTPFVDSAAGAARDALTALLNGATLCPFSIKQDGLETLARWLVKEGITIFTSVITVFRHFVATLSGEEQFDKLRLIYARGEQVTAKDVELYQKHFSSDCLFVNRLGVSETGTVAYYFIGKRPDSLAALCRSGIPRKTRKYCYLMKMAKK